MGAYNNLLTSLDDGILTITFNRPDKLNALNFETLKELDRAIDAYNQNAEVAGVILTGSGDKAFVAGADINEIASLEPKEGKEAALRGQQVFQKLENGPKPVIGMINGYALGGGCELAMACHIRIASDNAMFGQPEINLGIIPGYGGTQRLTHYVGKGKALELMLTGDMITAQEALSIGLVNQVVLQDELEITVKRLMQKIIKKAPVGIGNIITSVNSFTEPCENGYMIEANQFANCFSTSDFKEGTQAFLEKRKPNFRGN